MNVFLKFTLLAVLVSIAPLPFPARSCAAESKLSDQSLTLKLKQLLRSDQRLQHLEIEVDVHGGEVTLKGGAPSHFEKYRAKQLCQRIDGVRRVRNQLKVKRLPYTDRAIGVEVTRQLNRDLFLREKDLSAKVTNRVVTLTGQVDSWTQKQRAGILSRKVLSVVRVNNNLDVAPAPAYRSTHSDQDTQADVLVKIREDSHLLELEVSVTVNHGVAKLEGVVENYFQKERIVHHARTVRGVRRIDCRLEVSVDLSNRESKIGVHSSTARRVSVSVR